MAQPITRLASNCWMRLRRRVLADVPTTRVMFRECQWRAGDLARAWDYAHGLQRTDYVEQYASSKVDVSAIKNGKEMYYGAGNTVDGFNIIRHEGAGIEIGLKAKVRGGEDYAGIKQSDGVVEYHVGSGDAGQSGPFQMESLISRSRLV